MQPPRIAELLVPFLRAPVLTDSSERCHSELGRSRGEEPAFLSQAQLQSISTYIDLLIRWNARINLTAIRDPEEIVTRHFGESLFAARQLFPMAPAEHVSERAPLSVHTAADIGSGAGFPGIPIKVWQPNVNLTLIESNHKKAAFLREAARTLGLTNVEVRTDRAETIRDRTFDLVTVRAVDKMEQVLPAAARLLSPNGRLALFLSSRQVDAARLSLPLKWELEIPIPQSESRVLLIGKNQAST